MSEAAKYGEREHRDSAYYRRKLKNRGKCGVVVGSVPKEVKDALDTLAKRIDRMQSETGDYWEIKRRFLASEDELRRIRNAIEFLLGTGEAAKILGRGTDRDGG